MNQSQYACSRIYGKPIGRGLLFWILYFPPFALDLFDLSHRTEGDPRPDLADGSDVQRPHLWPGRVTHHGPGWFPASCGGMRDVMSRDGQSGVTSRIGEWGMTCDCSRFYCVLTSSKKKRLSFSDNSKYLIIYIYIH